MKFIRSRERWDAFSLIEILVALGLFTVAIMALLALFPVALRTEKESEAETRATMIASGIMETLAPVNGGDFLRVATGMSNGLPVWERLNNPVGKNTNLAVAYNSSCEPILRLTDEQLLLPFPDSRGSAIVTVSLVQKTSLPGLISAEVCVGSPASAPATRRSTQRFVRLISIP